MLSMSIFTFNPDKTEEVLKRRLEEEAVMPERIKIIGEWCSIKTGKVFRLIEGKNLNDTLTAFRRWSDLGKIEVISVMKSKELICRLGYFFPKKIVG